MSAASNKQDLEFRRRFPRRALAKSVGVLHKGEYYVGQCCEIGEGGMSFRFPKPLDPEEMVLVTFQIPAGQMVSLRMIVKNFRDDKTSYVMGCSYTELSFECKRQIRAYVSTRLNSQQF